MRHNTVSGLEDAIVLMKEILEASVRRKEKLYCALVDFTKAFDRVPLKEMFESTRSMKAPKGVVGGGYCGVSIMPPIPIG